jgi:hypothetical protein
VNIGGQINFARRPLSPTEKQQIHDFAYDSGAKFIREGGDRSQEPRVKANLIRNLSYRYRVAAGQTLQSKKIYADFKALIMSSFEEGAKSAGEPQT